MDNHINTKYGTPRARGKSVCFLCDAEFITKNVRQYPALCPRHESFRKPLKRYVNSVYGFSAVEKQRIRERLAKDGTIA